jgi:hypothetical protein
VSFPFSYIVIGSASRSSYLSAPLFR